LFGGSAVVAISAGALAQNSPQPPAVQPPAPAAGQTPLYDPEQLPALRGQVQQFTLTPRGDIDGLILSDGTEVKTPPRLSTEIAYSVRPGDTVTIHGLRAAALPLVQAVSITDDATGRTVVDNGPPGPGRGPGAGRAAPPSGLTEVQGRVRMSLHGPQGDVNGALLDDGTVLRLPPPEAYRFATLLQPGQALVAEGSSVATTIGKYWMCSRSARPRSNSASSRHGLDLAPAGARRHRRGPASRRQLRRDPKRSAHIPLFLQSEKEIRMHWLDPDYLPETSGIFERFLLNPHGDVDGMILTDGTEIHFPPHMSDELRAVIREGERSKIKVRGVRPRGSDMIAAVAIEMMDGKRIVDSGPPNGHDEDRQTAAHATKSKHEPMHAEGTVRRVVHGPKGEARGALLEDGTIIRIPAKEAKHITHLLVPGQRLAVHGQGLKSELGIVIDAREVGPSADDLHPLKPKEPKPKKHAPKDDDGANAAATG
jgi:hypothetical protein